jgi:hypothetical protein
MPRYYFDLKDGTRLLDPAGLDCRDDKDAELKALQIAADVARGKPDTDRQRHVAVINSEGHEILKVPVKPATVNPPASNWSSRVITK